MNPFSKKKLERTNEFNVPNEWTCEKCEQKNLTSHSRCSQCGYKRPENLSDTLNDCAKQLSNLVIEMMTDRNFKAKLIAMYVRNHMEDFHADYLSDEQMKELNPLIRNAIYTAIVDIEERRPVTSQLLYNVLLIPEYWEDCEYMDNHE